MSLLDEFKFPENLDAESRAFLSQQFQGTTVGHGVATLQAAGHDKNGMGYRFYIHPVNSEAKSEEFDMEINDDIEMIQWFKDKDHKPVERVTELPKELLHFAKKKISDVGGIAKYEYILSYEEDGVKKEDIKSVVLSKGAKAKNVRLICKGGLYADAYVRFQAGLGSQGLPLSRWDKLTMSQIKTLEAEGIFTVQQFAAQPSEKIEARFPPDLRKAFNEAVHFINAETKKADITPYANEVLAVRQENAKLLEAVAQLKEQMADLAITKLQKRKSAKKLATVKLEEKMLETMSHE